MEAVRIGDHKLKLSLSAEESRKYGIDGSADCRDTASVRKNVWQVLDAAKGITGFEPSGDKLLVQFYPMREGGCEIFVTKLGVLSESSARLVSSSGRISIISRRRSAYALLPNVNSKMPWQLIKRAVEQNLKADIYLSDNGGIFIVCEELSNDSPEPELVSILEYAVRLPSSSVGYITEHCKKAKNIELCK